MTTAPAVPPESTFSRLQFDPSAGTVIREPEGSGYGYWVGGHKVTFDEQSRQFVLFYRQRTPLETGRGGYCAVASSDDGVHFTERWRATKDQFAANSIEVGHVVRDPASGEWRLYISYEVAAGSYWRIDVVRGPSLDKLDTQGRRTVLWPHEYGLRVLKDPIVYLRDGKYWVYCAGPARGAPLVEGDTVHAGPLDATMLGISDDGLYFPTLRWVFDPPMTDTWDGRRARISSVIEMEGGFLATYDGGRTRYDQYEELCGLAWSTDGLHFERLAQAKPWVRSPYGCVRYVYALRHGDEILFYYEFTRADLSHDLRVARVRA
jgi:hypothetical protein